MRGKRRIETGRLTAAAIIAGFLVLTGIILGLGVSPWFYLAALPGLFGPAVLREFGLLRDLDEFQRDARRTAGNRAFLTGGIGIMVFAVVTSAGIYSDGNVSELLLSLLLIMLAVYVMSYASRFYENRRAASIILLIFGFFWSFFVILSEWGNWVSLVFEFASIPLPFLAMAFLSRRYPRIIGGLVAVLALFFFFFFRLFELSAHNYGKLVVIVLLIIPMLTVTVMLLGERKPPAEKHE